MSVVQRPDTSGFSQLPQSIDGKCKVGVLSDAGVIKSFAAVSLDQRRHIDIHGYFSYTGVPTANSVIEGLLMRCDYSGTRYQYKTTVTQWFFQWCPRYRLNAPPSVGFQKKPILKRKFTQIAQKFSSIRLDGYNGLDRNVSSKLKAQGSKRIDAQS
jgi:hypothetical protein